MPILKDILKDAPLIHISGDLDQNISTLQFDSRKVEARSIFFAIRGLQTDGHSYISQAIEKGATVIVCESLPENQIEGVTYLHSEHSARTLGLMAANYYDNPSQKIQIVGVTGTNGKTTSATLLYRLFRQLGYSVGLLSTIENKINEAVIPTQFTTPDPLVIQPLLADMVKRGCSHCFMEVSSHALVQERVAGIQFCGAIFTNISHDHLDFHKTFANYIAAKKKFFDELLPSAFALINLDDKRGPVMLQNCQAQTQKTYALQAMADFKAKLIENTLHGLLLEIDQQQVWFRLIGGFNAYNLLSVYATAMLLGEEETEVLQALSGLRPVPGRFEHVPSQSGKIAIVDYAHSPDALKNVLKTIEEVKTWEQKVITVVGCGGDRDKEKRPIMTDIALNYSHQVILTSDNPRNEDPQEILRDMTKHLNESEKASLVIIEDRRQAIQQACQWTQANHIILVAGKGHETYQEIKGIRHPFDDREVLKEYLDLDFNKHNTHIN